MSGLEEIIGRVIRRERQDRQLTIRELGDKAGLSEIYLGEIERGQKYPSAKVLESLAEALDLDVADLFVLIAEELRDDGQTEVKSAIGFVSIPGQSKRLVDKPPVNMVDGGEFRSIINFSDFLLVRRGA